LLADLMAMSTEDFTRIIAHADMDAFYAAVEQLDFPELRGKPVLVGGPGQRGVVATASYEARPFGVGSAMSMARARRLCPQAIVVPPRFERYSEMSRRIMAVFGGFSSRIQPLSLDEAFLDMSGAEHLFGRPAEMGRAIKEAVAEATGGLTVSIGFANTKFLAKVASDHDKPDGLTIVPPETVRAFLDPLPVSKLWGVGPKTRQRLVRLGLNTIRDVFRADALWLERQLGSLGGHIWRLAHNQDPRDVTTGRRAKSVSSERTLARDIVGAEAIKISGSRS
jgi:DNA polymerase-4